MSCLRGRNQRLEINLDQVIVKLDAAYYYAVRITFLVRNINKNEISLF
jgi:hypothetical protein